MPAFDESGECTVESGPSDRGVVSDPEVIKMTIEDKVFSRMRFDRIKMERYGFAVDGDELLAVRDFLDGDFTAEIRVNRNGKVTGRVIDRMNEEEYSQLRNENYYGAFVNTVRDAYERLLMDIASECCDEVSFASDQSNRLAGWILQEYGVAPDFPWNDGRNDTAGVFRHPDTGKWFGLIMNIKKGQLDRSLRQGDAKAPVDAINLKIDETKAGQLHNEEGIYPAFHMNHKKWISVILDDTVNDQRVKELVRDSFTLTAGKRSKMDEEFVHKVLSIADSVPYGKVATYGQIARIAGRERNSRMVGKIMSMADRYGDHPCHRVVNHAGRTVPGWKEQRPMLESEGIRFKTNGCVDLEKYQWDQ